MTRVLELMLALCCVIIACYTYPLLEYKRTYFPGNTSGLSCHVFNSLVMQSDIYVGNHVAKTAQLQKMALPVFVNSS